MVALDIWLKFGGSRCHFQFGFLRRSLNNLFGAKCSLHDRTSLSQQAKLDFTYGKFSAAAENYLLDTCGLELAQYKPYTGRGEIPNLSLKAVVPPNKVGSYYKDSTVTYFSTLQARVVEMLKLKNSHKWGRAGNHKQWLIVATWVCSQGAHVNAHVVPLDLPEAQRFFVDGLSIKLRLSIGMSLRELQRLKQELHELVTELHKSQMRNSAASFKQWLLQQIRTGGGKAVHTLLKQPLQQSEEVAYLDREKWGPTLIEGIDARAEFWAGVWKPLESVGDASFLETLRARAIEAQLEIPPLSMGQLLAVLKASPDRTGLGIDQWLAKLCLPLPVEARFDLLKILRQCENALDWPSAVKCNLIALIPKPTGGERPIGLTSPLYRVWSAMRKCMTSAWEIAHQGFWDTAIKGSSPLRAAILRELQAELCNWHGVSHSQVLWDMEKFFDSISQMALVKSALALGYPALNLYMGLMVHRGDRYLTFAGCVSKPIPIKGKSILAGCPQSVAWTRCLLHDILDHMHAAYRPVSIQSWVDDLAQRVQGSPKVVLEKTVSVCLELARQLKHKRLHYLPKKCNHGFNSKVAQGHPVQVEGRRPAAQICCCR